MNPVSPWPTSLLIALVKGYRLLFSPWLGSACRFYPTCSAYSMQALQQHGAAPGVYLTLARLARCHPWCEGGVDPVPDKLPRWRPAAADETAASASPRTLFP
ncbi:MAG: membrane protein insertion efficiency factor YidD [Burkholderiaceae bacterium]